MTWLVTGGAGYIGSHVVLAMVEAGEDVVVLDDLSSGDLGRIPGVPLVEGDVLDGARVAATIDEHDVRGVVHLAAKKAVEESVHEPLHYYRQNVEGLRVLLEAVTGPASPPSSSRPARPSTDPPTSSSSTRTPSAGRSTPTGRRSSSAKG